MMSYDVCTVLGPGLVYSRCSIKCTVRSLVVLSLYTLFHLTWQGCDTSPSPISEIGQLRPGVPSTSPDSADLVFAASQCYPASLFHPSSHFGAPWLMWPLHAPCGSVSLAPTPNSVAIPTVAPHPTHISMLLTIAGHHGTQRHLTNVH